MTKGLKVARIGGTDVHDKAALCVKPDSRTVLSAESDGERITYGPLDDGSP